MKSSAFVWSGGYTPEGVKLEDYLGYGIGVTSWAVANLVENKGEDVTDTEKAHLNIV